MEYNEMKERIRHYRCGQFSGKSSNKARSLDDCRKALHQSQPPPTTLQPQAHNYVEVVANKRRQ